MKVKACIAINREGLVVDGAQIIQNAKASVKQVNTKTNTAILIANYLHKYMQLNVSKRIAKNVWKFHSLPTHKTKKIKSIGKSLFMTN